MPVKHKIFLYLLLPIFVVLGLIQLYDYRENRASAATRIRHEVSERAQNYANRVDSLLNQVSSVAVTTAQFLSTDESLSEQTLYEVLRRNVGDNRLIYGAAIAFEPGLFKGRPLFCPYVYRSGNGVKSIDIGTQSYDYTKPEWEWYYRPRKLSAAVWTEPYFDQGAGNITMVTFSVPFYRHGRVAGIATVDLDLGRLLELAEIQDSDQSNLFILSRGGNFVYPQNKTELIMPLLAGSAGIPKAHAVKLQPLLDSKSTQFLEMPTADEKNLWYSMAQIKTANWSFLVRLDPEVTLKEMNKFESLIFLLILLTLVLGTFVAWFLVGRIINPIGRLANAVEEITHGNLAVVVTPESNDEVGQLARNFSSMAQRLAERERALVSLNEALESRVQERTTELHERQVKLETIIDTAMDAVVQMDSAGIIIGWNAQAEKIFGWGRDEAIGRMLHETIIPPHFREVHLRGLHHYLSSGEGPMLYSRIEVNALHRSGNEFLVELSVTPVMTEGKREFNAFIRDITDRKQAEDNIKQLAFFDPLTQLPNRRLLMDRLQQALASCARNRQMGALLFIDLDNFKTLNDTLGHDIGDLLLQQVAERLVACVRDGDTVARLGGDEFVVMLEDLGEDPQEAAFRTEIAGEKIRTSLNQPYQLSGHDHTSTPSIGVTLFSDSQIRLDELMKRADIAMYQSKKSGRNTIRFFDPDMQAAVETRLVMERWMQQALPQSQFLLHYQKQVTGTGETVGAEVLLRWQHPSQGTISPADFIPLAEETGLIVPIGLWVLETACNQLKAWESDAGKQHLQLAVNVSARQFRQPDFVDQVLSALHKTGANPARLKLELTESLVLDNLTEAIRKMQAIKQAGVQFSMDDFGTGHSSLSNLKKLPLDQLKIDQSFVRDIATDRDDAIIVQTIIAMAKNMGMEVIAEGVETEDQRAFLAMHDCQRFQGYLFGRPVPIEEFERMFSQSPHPA